MEGNSIERQEGFGNPYKNSRLIEKVKNSKKIAFLDIDSTLTGNPVIARQIRAKLEEKDCAVVFVTSRTEEMVISEEDFKATDPKELKRIPPHLDKTPEGKYEYADPKTLTEHSPFVGGDAIAGTTGSRIFIKQKGGSYKLDREFEGGMRQESEAWRQGVFTLLKFVDPQSEVKVAAVDSSENFTNNDVDVYPPNYRIQLEFLAAALPTQGTGSTDGGMVVSQERSEALLEQKRSFIEKVDQIKSDPTSPQNIKDILSNIRITDDSNPRNGRYQLYMTPHQGYKARAVEQIIQNIVGTSGINKNELHVVFAGDSYPDVAMGLYSATGTKAAFIVAGGSRLTPVFTEGNITEFAGESFKAIKKRLSGDPEKGILEFDQPLYGKRKIIIGDKVFAGKSAPESVLAALDMAFEDAA